MKSHALNTIVFVCWRETHYWPPLVLVQYRLHQSNWDLVKKKSWRPEGNFLKVSHAPGCVTLNKSFLLRSRSLQLSTFAGNLSTKKTDWRVKKSSLSCWPSLPKPVSPQSTWPNSLKKIIFVIYLCWLLPDSPKHNSFVQSIFHDCLNVQIAERDSVQKCTTPKWQRNIWSMSIF